MGAKIDFQAFRALMAARHSEYYLAPEWVAPQKSVEGMLGDLLQQMPTHFNCQPVRVVLLTGAAHARHWDLVAQALLAKIGQARFDDGTKQKIATSFASGVATLLFYDDTATTQRMVAQFPSLAANFPKWAQQVQGSHQYMAWTCGIGVWGECAALHWAGRCRDCHAGACASIVATRGADAVWPGGRACGAEEALAYPGGAFGGGLRVVRLGYQ